MRPVHRVWGWITGFGRFWYGFIIGDDWAAAAGVLVMLGAAYGLLLLHVPAWWAGPVVITATLLITLRRAARRHEKHASGERGESQALAAQGQQVRSAQRRSAAMDITELILSDHREQRRMFAILDELGSGPDRLAPVWNRLAVLLEVHADAEERLFYPKLLRAGEGAGGADGAIEETKDAIRDHDDIRDGIRRARRHDVGSSEWWQAVTDTRIANGEHMAEEEREALADFRRHASLETRHDLAVEFAVYEAAHTSGVPMADRDPDRYVQDHTR